MKPGQVAGEEAILDKYAECLIVDEALAHIPLEQEGTIVARFFNQAKELGVAVGIEGFLNPGTSAINIKHEPEFRVLVDDVPFVQTAALAVIENRNGRGSFANRITGRRRAAKAILSQLSS